MTEGQPIRVIMVDDHAMLRKGLRFFLTNSEDLELVGEAESGQEAIALCAELNPDVVLMDEPTGNLDPHSASQVLALIDELGQESAAFVVVTHDPAIAAHMNRTLELREGGLRELV